MTRQDAIEYDNWLKSGLMQEAEVLGLGEKAGSDLADRYITVIPDDERKGMVFLGGEAASYKLGNVRLDRSRITLKSSSSYNVADGISPFAILQKIQSLIVLSSQIEYINYTSDNSENHIFFQNFLKNFWNSIFYFCRIISIF